MDIDKYVMVNREVLKMLFEFVRDHKELSKTPYAMYLVGAVDSTTREVKSSIKNKEI